MNECIVSNIHTKECRNQAKLNDMVAKKLNSGGSEKCFGREKVQEIQCRITWNKVTFKGRNNVVLRKNIEDFQMNKTQHLGVLISKTQKKDRRQLLIIRFPDEENLLKFDEALKMNETAKSEPEVLQLTKPPKRRKSLVNRNFYSSADHSNGASKVFSYISTDSLQPYSRGTDSKLQIPSISSNKAYRNSRGFDQSSYFHDRGNIDKSESAHYIYETRIRSASESSEDSTSYLINSESESESVVYEVVPVNTLKGKPEMKRRERRPRGSSFLEISNDSSSSLSVIYDEDLIRPVYGSHKPSVYPECPTCRSKKKSYPLIQ